MTAQIEVINVTQAVQMHRRAEEPRVRGALRMSEHDHDGFYWEPSPEDSAREISCSTFRSL